MDDRRHICMFLLYEFRKNIGRTFIFIVFITLEAKFQVSHHSTPYLVPNYSNVKYEPSSITDEVEVYIKRHKKLKKMAHVEEKERRNMEPSLFCVFIQPRIFLQVKQTFEGELHGI